MKVLYAIQGTGNGHVARAREIIPALADRCDLEIALSGRQSQVELPLPINHDLAGLTFTFGRSGGIDYLDTWREASLPRLYKEIRDFPAEDYDLIVNDFGPVTAWAALKKGIPSVSLSHQSAVLSRSSPRPANRSRAAELFMRHYAPCQEKIGFHFDEYDDDIYTPVIRNEVRALNPYDGGKFLVYLPAYDDHTLVELFCQIPQCRWQIFTRHIKNAYELENINVIPISNQAYISSLESCSGLVTGGGFEAPAEALFLGKKLIVVPQRGQYEQQCNAEALRLLGVPILAQLNPDALQLIGRWAIEPQSVQLPTPYSDFKETVMDDLFEKGHKLESVPKKVRRSESILNRLSRATS